MRARRESQKVWANGLFKAWLGHEVNSHEIDHAICFGYRSQPTKGGAQNMALPNNSGKAWTPAQNAALRSLAIGNTPTRVAGLKLGRTPGAVQSQASKLGVSLKPTNQSPYGTVKKK
jgi:hypothetical protein